MTRMNKPMPTPWLSELAGNLAASWRPYSREKPPKLGVGARKRVFVAALAIVTAEGA